MLNLKRQKKIEKHKSREQQKHFRILNFRYLQFFVIFGFRTPKANEKVKFWKEKQISEHDKVLKELQHKEKIGQRKNLAESRDLSSIFFFKHFLLENLCISAFIGKEENQGNAVKGEKNKPPLQSAKKNFLVKKIITDRFIHCLSFVMTNRMRNYFMTLEKYPGNSQIELPEQIKANTNQNEKKTKGHHRIRSEFGVTPERKGRPFAIFSLKKEGKSKVH